MADAVEQLLLDIFGETFGSAHVVLDEKTREDSPFLQAVFLSVAGLDAVWLLEKGLDLYRERLRDKEELCHVSPQCLQKGLKFFEYFHRLVNFCTLQREINREPLSSQLCHGDQGEEEVLVDGHGAYITDHRTVAVGGHNEVQYKVSFRSFPKEDTWYSVAKIRGSEAEGETLIQEYHARMQQAGDGEHTANREGPCDDEMDHRAGLDGPAPPSTVPHEETGPASRPAVPIIPEPASQQEMQWQPDTQLPFTQFPFTQGQGQEGSPGLPDGTAASSQLLCWSTQAGLGLPSAASPSFDPLTQMTLSQHAEAIPRAGHPPRDGAVPTVSPEGPGLSSPLLPPRGPGPSTAASARDGNARSRAREEPANAPPPKRARTRSSLSPQGEALASPQIPATTSGAGKLVPQDRAAAAGAAPQGDNQELQTEALPSAGRAPRGNRAVRAGPVPPAVGSPGSDQAVQAVAGPLAVQTGQPGSTGGAPGSAVQSPTRAAGTMGVLRTSLQVSQGPVPMDLDAPLEAGGSHTAGPCGISAPRGDPFEASSTSRAVGLEADDLAACMWAARVVPHGLATRARASVAFSVDQLQSHLASGPSPRRQTRKVVDRLPLLNPEPLPQSAAAASNPASGPVGRPHAVSPRSTPRRPPPTILPGASPPPATSAGPLAGATPAPPLFHTQEELSPAVPLGLRSPGDQEGGPTMSVRQLASAPDQRGAPSPQGSWPLSGWFGSIRKRPPPPTLTAVVTKGALEAAPVPGMVPHATEDTIPQQPAGGSGLVGNLFKAFGKLLSSPQSGRSAGSPHREPRQGHSEAGQPEEATLAAEIPGVQTCRHPHSPPPGGIYQDPQEGDRAGRSLPSGAQPSVGPSKLESPPNPPSFSELDAPQERTIPEEAQENLPVLPQPAPPPPASFRLEIVRVPRRLRGGASDPARWEEVPRITPHRGGPVWLGLNALTKAFLAGDPSKSRTARVSQIDYQKFHDACNDYSRGSTAAVRTATAHEMKALRKALNYRGKPRSLVTLECARHVLGGYGIGTTSLEVLQGPALLFETVGSKKEAGAPDGHLVAGGTKTEPGGPSSPGSPTGPLGDAGRQPAEEEPEDPRGAQSAELAPELLDEEVPDEEVVDEEVADKEVADEEVPDEEVPHEEVLEEEVSDEELLDEEVRLSEEGWATAQITKVRRDPDGELVDMRVEWGDGFWTWIEIDLLRARPHCLQTAFAYLLARVRPKRD
eukprot:jgi/Botrbrau1/23321/Bobra.0102s0058.3